MVTLAEPKQEITCLWGKQRAGEGTYRLMKYVLRVEHRGRVLLYNLVTGQLAALDPEEAALLDTLPAARSPRMDPLIADHFLVPEHEDEHRQTAGLRTVLQKLQTAQWEECITTYTILPTTGCNARCYYCFEHGVKASVMTEETARDTVDFIVRHSGNAKKVFLTWFGGEPTLCMDRIDQICLGLRNAGITYESKLVTNGYLLDREIAAKARSLWHLNFVQICVDGTEENHNRIKAYVGAADNPYQRTLRNAQDLLDAGIRVKLRMNFDLGNAQDFGPFVEEVKQRFHGHPLLTVSAHPIIGCYCGPDGSIRHGSDAWFGEKIAELTGIAADAGLYHRDTRLTGLVYRACMAARDYAVTIRPDGSLVKCPEQFGDDQIIGSLHDGITNHQLVQSWKQTADPEKCRDCVLFPTCFSVVNCLTGDLCMHRKQRIAELTEAVRWQFDTLADKV